MILLEAVCITLYNQNPNTTFKIRFWVFAEGLWRAGSSERRVMPSKLMKRGWKYPLKHQEGGEGTPSKDSKLGALLMYVATIQCLQCLPKKQTWKFLSNPKTRQLSPLNLCKKKKYRKNSGIFMISDWFQAHKVFLYVSKSNCTQKKSHGRTGKSMRGDRSSEVRFTYNLLSW